MTMITKTKDAQTMGEYKPTAIDKTKAQVDFRIVGLSGKYEIRWKDGHFERVTKRQLKKLQSAHKWATDF